MSTPISSRIGAWRRKLSVSLAVAFLAGSGSLVAAPLHAFAAQTITLTASTTTAAAGTAVTFTATASPTPAPDYTIEIDETTRSDYVNSCFDENPCTGAATYPTSGSRVFQATLTNNAGVTTLSSTVTVTWTGNATAAYSIALTASSTQANDGQDVTLTATASPNIPTGYFIDIIDENGNDFNCYELQTCSEDVSGADVTHTYTAYLDNDPNTDNPPTGTIATSAPVSVTWFLASTSLCDPATLPVSGSIGGIVNYYLATRPGIAETDVCFRVSAGTTAVGGAVVIKPGSARLPQLSGGDLCLTADPSKDTLQTAHPLFTTTVDGVAVSLDAHVSTSGGDTLVCATAGSFAETVVIPGGLGDVVSFVPDGDSILP